jgi:GNAT superfamily N-acetyltransferase
VEYSDQFRDDLTKLLGLNRIALAELRSIKKELDLRAAEEELDYFLGNEFPIYLAIDEMEKILGFIVCKIEDDVVWGELLYVIPEFRRKGIGSALFAKAEGLAEKLGCETLYNWVHPNNFRSIPFLKKRGYNVINLIEVRKKVRSDIITQKIQVGKFEFDY